MNGERVLNKSRGCFIFFPAFIMFLITTFVYSELFLKEKEIESKWAMFLLLIIVFPLLFFIQGYLLYKKRMGIVYPWSISIISFITIVLIFYNHSFLGYGIFYTILEFAGYFIPKFFSVYINNQ